MKEGQPVVSCQELPSLRGSPPPRAGNARFWPSGPSAQLPQEKDEGGPERGLLARPEAPTPEGVTVTPALLQLGLWRTKEPESKT